MRPRAVAPPCPAAACALLVVTVVVVAVAVPAASGARPYEPVPTPVPTGEPTRHLDDVACSDPLVVHRPDGSLGDTAAVAITSQAIERDGHGWGSVGWQAASGTTLTTILVTTPSGVQQHPGEPSGTASRVLELAFCGTREATAAPSLVDGEGSAAATEARTAPVRFDGPAGVDTDTLPGSVFGAAFGLTVGTVVLLLSRSARREREAER